MEVSSLSLSASAEASTSGVNAELSVNYKQKLQSVCRERPEGHNWFGFTVYVNVDAAGLDKLKGGAEIIFNAEMKQASMKEIITSFIQNANAKALLIQQGI